MSTLVNTLPEGEFHCNSVNLINITMFIVDAIVKELVYSGNSVVEKLSNHLHNH